jgi:uncharacterized membrane protein (DUF485 family)
MKSRIIAAILVLAIPVLLWFSIERSLASLLALVFFFVILLFSLLAGYITKKFASKKPGEKKRYTTISTTIVILISVLLISSVLFVIIPITQPKEGVLKENEVLVEIDKADIKDFSLKAPSVNVTLSLMDECNVNNMDVRKGSITMSLEEPVFKDVRLETTYLDTKIDLNGIEIPLSLYGETRVPLTSALSSIMKEITLEDVEFHTPSFSASSMHSKALTLKSAGAPAIIKAEKLSIPELTLRPLISSLLSEKKILINEIEIENGSFILDNVPISFDSAVLQNAELELNIRELIELNRDELQSLLSKALRSLPSALSTDTLELSDITLSLTGEVKTSASRIENMRIG